MHAITALYGAVLFVLLTPGLVLRIPSKGPLLHASIIHAIVFGILLYFICKLVHQNSRKIENFDYTKHYQIYNNEQNGCVAKKCQSAINLNISSQRKDVIGDCKGCNLVTHENENDKTCQKIDKCNELIIGHLNELPPTVPDNLWDSNKECVGCTKLIQIDIEE